MKIMKDNDCFTQCATITFLLYTLLHVTSSSIHELSSISRNARSLRLKFQTCPLPHLENGRVTIRSRNRAAVFKCGKKFQLFGEKFSTCVRGHWTSPMPTCVKPGCPPLSSITNGVVLPVPKFKYAVLNFSCDPGYFLVGSPVIVCDGKSWNSTAPECKADYKTSLTSCDFSTDDLCGWTQEKNTNSTNGVQRFRRIGSTRSENTGMGSLYDHTLGQGHYGNYMYTDKTMVGGRNSIARIFSPVYSPELSQDACFTFWYHIHGLNTGTLNVYIKPEGLKIENVKPILKIKGDQEDVWMESFFNISKLEVPFQIVIEYAGGVRFFSYFAFDDVRLNNGFRCNHYPSVTTIEASTYLPTINHSMSNMPDTTNSVTYNTTTKTVSLITLDTNSRQTLPFRTINASFTPTKTVPVTVTPVNVSLTGVFQRNVSDHSYRSTPLTSESLVASQLTTEMYDLPRESRTQQGFTFHSTSSHKLLVTTATFSKPLESITTFNITSNTTTPTTNQTTRAMTRPTAQGRRTTIPTSTRVLNRLTTRSTTRHTKQATTQPVTHTTTRFTTPTKSHKIPTNSTTRRSPIVAKTTVQLTTMAVFMRASPSWARGISTLVAPRSTQMTDFLKPHISAKQRSEKSTMPIAVGGTVIAILACICAGVFVFIAVRRRRRRRYRDDLSNDSDVRFLTADEILDFTLATPKDFRDDDI